MSLCFKICVFLVIFFAECNGTPAKYYNTFVQRVRHPIHIQNIGITNKGYPFPFGLHSRITGRNVNCRTKGKPGCMSYAMPLVHAPLVAPVVAHPFMPGFYADHVANCNDESHEHNSITQYLNKIIQSKRPKWVQSYYNKDKKDHRFASSSYETYPANSENDNSDTTRKTIELQSSSDYIDSIPINGNKHGGHGKDYDSGKVWKIVKTQSQQNGESDSSDDGLKIPLISDIKKTNPELLNLVLEMMNKDMMKGKGYGSQEHEVYDDLGWTKTKEKPYKPKSGNLKDSLSSAEHSSLETQEDKFNYIKEMLNNQGPNSAVENFSDYEPKKTIIKDSSQFPEYFEDSNDFPSPGTNIAHIVPKLPPFKHNSRTVPPKSQSNEEHNYPSREKTTEYPKDIMDTSEMSMESVRPYFVNGKIVHLTPNEIQQLQLQQNGNNDIDIKLIPLEDDDIVKGILNQNKKHDKTYPEGNEYSTMPKSSTENINIYSKDGDTRQNHDKTLYELPHSTTKIPSYTTYTIANPKLDSMKNSNPSSQNHDTSEYFNSNENDKFPKNIYETSNTKSYPGYSHSFEYDTNIQPKPTKSTNLLNQDLLNQSLNQKCPRFDTLFKHLLNGLDKFLEKLQECTCTKEAFAELFKNIHGYC